MIECTLTEKTYVYSFNQTSFPERGWSFPKRGRSFPEVTVNTVINMGALLLL